MHIILNRIFFFSFKAACQSSSWYRRPLEIATMTDLGQLIRRWLTPRKTAVFYFPIIVFVLIMFMSLKSENQSVKREKTVQRQNFSLNVIVLTYKRAGALAKCLKSLAEASYEGDRVDIDVWIDRDKGNVLDNHTYHVASTFQWRHGRFSVHQHTVHVGIYGQWLTTYPANRLGLIHEHVVFIEDDIIVSRAYYRWLKLMHSRYAARNDVSGFALQGKIFVMSGKNALSPLSVPKKHPVFMYRIFGTWGFSPKRHVWEGFLDWYEQAKLNSTLQPYVPNILPTSWYKSLQRSKKGDSMWSIWFLYYTYMKQLYCIFPNYKDGVLAINMELPGLHYSGNSKVQTTGLLRMSQLTNSDVYPTEPIHIHYDGSVVSTEKKMN